MRSPDEARTINECQRSHRQGQVPDSVVRSYCACMAESRATRGSVHLAPGGVADGRDHAACERRSGMR
ncbi:hypothetical protein [Falsiroseomonas sp.]|uniref:hypothetical protein n=1 Tax=Falsiroseomonas sp. TaxID=2870721 RepID=UPI003F70316E